MSSERKLTICAVLLLALITAVFFYHERKIALVGGGDSGVLANINKRLDDLASKVNSLLADVGSKPAEAQAQAAAEQKPERPNFKDFCVSPDTGKLEAYALVEATPHYNLKVDPRCPAPACPPSSEGTGVCLHEAQAEECQQPSMTPEQAEALSERLVKGIMEELRKEKAEKKTEPRPAPRPELQVQPRAAPKPELKVQPRPTDRKQAPAKLKLCTPRTSLGDSRR